MEQNTEPPLPPYLDGLDVNQRSAVEHAVHRSAGDLREAERYLWREARFYTGILGGFYSSLARHLEGFNDTSGLVTPTEEG
jgi:hypothetical protein